YVCFKPAVQLRSVAHAGNGPVPDPDSKRFLVDPGNASALESALVLRERGEVRHVISISIGPEAFDNTLAWCRAAGADKVLRVDVLAGLNLDARATATLLADTIFALGGKLVLTAQRSIDESNGLVAAALASNLKAAYLSNVVDIQILNDEVKVSRKIERGHRQLWSAGLPAVVAVDPGSQTSLYIPVANLALAKQASVETLATSTEDFAPPPNLMEQIKLAPGRIRTRRSAVPATVGTAAERLQAVMGTTSKETDKKLVLSGDTDDLARHTLAFLEDKGLLPNPRE
ncbi:MAG TPA: hypothetical protein QF695_13150, partial [Arenicellales bacterium]|nr:hypothetical protein [Arenicellales bacterium]